MGNSGSSSNAESSGNSSTLPEGVTKISETLYQLYSPGSTPEIDIIFFHGLQVSDYRDAYWKTWSRDEKTNWPQTLLGKELPRARILAVSYDSCARETETAGRMDIFQIAENLVKSIIHDNKASVGRNQCPVILVGHSFGGFVIKNFLQTAYDSRKRDVTPEKPHERTARIDKFLDNLSGIFYYATPHGGSRLADVVHKLPGNSPVLGFLQTLGKDPARLNDWFRDWRAAKKIPAYTIAESHPTNLKIWGVNFVVVEEASAREDTDDYYTAPENHINVCKPQDVHEGTFQYLLQFIYESILKHTLRSNDDSELLR